jgi:hypothetical protein
VRGRRHGQQHARDGGRRGQRRSVQWRASWRAPGGRRRRRRRRQGGRRRRGDHGGSGLPYSGDTVYPHRAALSATQARSAAATVVMSMARRVLVLPKNLYYRLGWILCRRIQMDVQDSSTYSANSPQKTTIRRII